MEDLSGPRSHLRSDTVAGTFPYALADRCVKCGLCAPHCPTYRLSGEEGESPRGRISLMQGLARGRLEATDRLTEHLENCLGCRTCESVCPAQVPYGEIIDAGRAELRRHGRAPDAVVLALAMLCEQRWIRRVAFRLLWLARTLGLDQLASRFEWGSDSWLKRALQINAGVGRPLKLGESHPALSSHKGDIDLFVGCVARNLDADVHAATVDVLTALGYSVHVPASQTCCGALAQHGGDAVKTRMFARQNCDAFGDAARSILTSASGCAATLAEYGRLAGDKTGKDFSRRVQDVSTFLLEKKDELRPRLQPTAKRVAVHAPCTARNPHATPDVVPELLSLIPDVEIVTLDSTGCCGAAGHHFLTRGSQADALLAPLLEQVRHARPDYVVTSNTGCATHLAHGLQRAAAGPSVAHPVQIVAKSIQTR